MSFHHFHHLFATIASVLVAFALTTGCSSGDLNLKMETITQAETWASPMWGYHTPKIVRNNSGECWTIVMNGSYPDADMQIFKRTLEGNWVAGYKFEDHYQPGMLFLDSSDRLNVILNAQDRPIEHWRSTDQENRDNFELVAKGNGLPDGRGWYVGVGVRDDRVMMAYITLEYEAYFTHKLVLDTSWAPAILIHEGYPDPKGNHSLLYTGFEYTPEHTFIYGSYCVDGSVHNTYRDIVLKRFPNGHPEAIESETVFAGDSGYYAYAYDIIADPKLDRVYIAHSAGIHSYGKVVPDVPEEGLYVSHGRFGEQWTLSKVMSGKGCLTLHLDRDSGHLYALCSSGGWDEVNVLHMFRSEDEGHTWVDVSSTELPAMPEDLLHPYFVQNITHASGSVFDQPGFVFSNTKEGKTDDGLYQFDIQILHAWSDGSE